MAKIEVTETTYASSFTYEYALWRIKVNCGVINCPFGSLDNYALNRLEQDGYQIEIINDKEYRGTKYKGTRL